MRRLLLLVLAVLFFSTLADLTMAQDAGVPDTLYVEVYPGDQFVKGPSPWLVKFPIFVTNDIVDPAVDSIAGFVIPMCYQYTGYGESDYCRATSAYNNSGLLVWPWDSSIFRHLPSMDDPQILHPWMVKAADYYLSQEIWDYREIILDGSSTWWLVLAPNSSKDKRWEGGSRVLLATMTFEVDFVDSLILCIDSCFWPPTNRLAFSNSQAETYIPQHFLPVCQRLMHSSAPFFGDCPYIQYHNSNGHYVTEEFYAQASGMDYRDEIVFCMAEYVGEGVENVTVHYHDGYLPPGHEVRGHVEYDVVDHCQFGGYIKIDAQDRDGEWVDVPCVDSIILNRSPVLSLPDTTLAIAGNTRQMFVSATDQDDDSLAIEFDALWYEPDSLRSPTNAPSFDGGNPGLFTWVPAEGEEGNWICSFTGTDACDAITTNRTTIMVGLLFCGDSNPDEVIDLGDLIYLLNYLFKGGPSPDPLCKGDATCDEAVDLGDLVRLLNYLFKNGPAPCFDCCPR